MYDRNGHRHIMKRVNDRKGFTLAELLIAVAIIMILAGFGFVNVISHQRRLKLKEMDEAAKEIFMASQNYLTAAWADGDLEAALKAHADDGYLGTPKESGSKIYVAVSYNDHRETGSGRAISDLLLPFGSIDETVRSGGSYVIVYDAENAGILQVMYGEYGQADISGYSVVQSTLENADYLDTLSAAQRIDEAKNNLVDGKRNYIGYYHAPSDGISASDSLLKPSIKIHNAENLWVEVINPNEGGGTGRVSSVEIRMTGMQSGVAITGTLDSDGSGPFHWTRLSGPGTGYGIYKILLDSVTLGKEYHFCNMFGKGDLSGDNEGKKLIPGEDIQISVVLRSETTGQEVETSSPAFNSLFAGITKSAADEGGTDAAGEAPYDTAYIANIRHLENLNLLVSGISDASIEGDAADLKIRHAQQSENLDFEDFTEKAAEDGTLEWIKPTETSVKIWDTAGKNYDDSDGKPCFYPVSTLSLASYDGNRHSISNLNIHTGSGENAGLFGLFEGGKISDLELVDCMVTAEGGSAGALAGKLVNADISNVAVHESVPKTMPTGYDEKNYSFVKASGHAGGLIGELVAAAENASSPADIMYNGSCKISDAASAVLVQSTGTGAAGGLIGKITAESGAGGKTPSVLQSYAGGHTWQGMYETGTGADKEDIINVKSAGGAAGGLVGVAGSAEVKHSYSTCSVSGRSAAGGLIGELAAGKVENCYAFAPVQGDGEEKTGALAGTAAAGAVFTDCKFCEVINEVRETKDGKEVLKGYLPAVGNMGSAEGLKAVDDDLTTYKEFIPDDDKREEAQPADPFLREVFASGSGTVTYSLKTVDQLSEAAPSGEGTFTQVHYGDWMLPGILVVNEK